jgi:hypothetical protein
VIYFIYRIQHMHNPSVQRRKEGNIDVMRCNHLYWKKNITTKQSNKYVQNQYLWSYLMGMAERLKKGIFWTKQTQAKPGSYLQISKHMNKLFKTLSQMISTCSGSVLTEFELLPHLCFLFVWDTNTRYCYFLYINLIILELISG